ncbi:MAG: dipeptide/oligopeptide/nickel ABC transporter ATP-binding protein [Geobacteraceae bacterium GWC2_58_44]|nr:MAG: dipeptide/oligopeptide/nickel ABC transporter ATP-binding protein [Geobacteraceae bacterium GWC2_58_44]HBG05962.1 dipeptide/oligopeptide/nickel ABC transporter ATP-binding protein [Geobacter sp.]
MTELLALDQLTVELQTAAGPISPVDSVSLTLAPGKTLALVGESGSGKSMLCRAILGLVPSRGRICFVGRDTANDSAKELNRIRGREIGVVLQDPLSSLNPVMTVLQQIFEPMRFHLGIGSKEGRERALELLRSVGMPNPEERLGCYPHQLSGGMRQRVAIAIALACDPKLLIADEPTTALDVTVQADILNLLSRIQQQRNMAIILVSHDLGVVAGRAHDIAVMYAGRIVEQGPTAAVFARMRMRYTRLLFEAIPRIDDPPQRRLPNIPDQPPNFAALPPGCRFAPRCPAAAERCRHEYPPLVADGRDGHLFACWFPCEPPEGTP